MITERHLFTALIVLAMAGAALLTAIIVIEGAIS